MINDALMNLVDSISINNAGEKLQNGELTATPNFEERTSENISGSKKEFLGPIIECDDRINFQNLMQLIDKSKLDMHSHCWFIRWFVKKEIFILYLPEIAEGPLYDAELYQYLRDRTQKRKTECGEGYQITSEDYINFIDDYSKFCIHIKKNTLLSFMLSNRLLIIKRALLSANKITECRNELVDEYWPSKKRKTRKTRSKGKARTSDA